MKSKLRFVIIIFAVALLFYVHDNPLKSKEIAAETSNTLAQTIEENMTEENIQHAVNQTFYWGNKVSETCGRIIENVLAEMGYENE